MLNKCNKCGAELQDLFSSSYCPNNCDNPQYNTPEPAGGNGIHPDVAKFEGITVSGIMPMPHPPQQQHVDDKTLSSDWELIGIIESITTNTLEPDIIDIICNRPIGNVGATCRHTAYVEKRFVINLDMFMETSGSAGEYNLYRTKERLNTTSVDAYVTTYCIIPKTQFPHKQLELLPKNVHEQFAERESIGEIMEAGHSAFKDVKEMRKYAESLVNNLPHEGLANIKIAGKEYLVSKCICGEIPIVHSVATPEKRCYQLVCYCNNARTSGIEAKACLIKKYFWDPKDAVKDWEERRYPLVEVKERKSPQKAGVSNLLGMALEAPKDGLVTVHVSGDTYCRATIKLKTDDDDLTAGQLVYLCDDDKVASRSFIESQRKKAILNKIMETSRKKQPILVNEQHMDQDQIYMHPCLRCYNREIGTGRTCAIEGCKHYCEKDD